MQDIVRRFWGFDQLLGVGLVKIIYYFGLIGICAAIGIGLILAIMTLVSDVGRGAVQMIAIPAVGLVALVYWRFLCEFFIVVFEMNERLGEIRDAARGYPAPAPVDPNHPAF